MRGLISGLSRRQHRVEWMDDPALPLEMHRRALAGLARINCVSRAVVQIWQPIAELARRHGPIRVLDIATGGGDIPIGLHRLAQREGLKLRITGCDVSEQALTFARERARQSKADVAFVRLDALRDALPDGFDVLACSLFLHHLEEQRVVELLASMARAARRMVVISDLERSRVGYVLAIIGTRLLSFSSVVHADGPISVAGAFTLEEASHLARKAGLASHVIERIYPWRWRMIWRREATP